MHHPPDPQYNTVLFRLQRYQRNSLKDLKRVYGAVDEQTALEELKNSKQNGGKKYLRISVILASEKWAKFCPHDSSIPGSPKS